MMEVVGVKYPFRNLVFEGGGVKGIAYAGALEVLEKRKILKDIVRVGGASAGAINAVLMALGYTRQEMLDVLLELDFRKFLDDSWGLLPDVKRLLREYGWFKGDFFEEWIRRQITKKGQPADVTFAQLKASGHRGLYLIGTNLSTGYEEVFSAERTPRMRVSKAVRMSMSIPLFFAAVLSRRGDVYVDGGVLDNYPVKLFDRQRYVASAERSSHVRRTDYYKKVNRRKEVRRNPYVYNMQTLGFRLDTAEEIAVFRREKPPAHQEIDQLFEYTWALIKTLLNAQNNQHLHSDDWHRTVYINTLDVKTTDFGIKKKDKERLIEQGKVGTEKYFDWYEGRTLSLELPVNRPREE
jgi:NTE family protein